MRIDYDQLREMVRVVEDPTAYGLGDVYDAESDLKDLAPDMARELLRLRDGVEKQIIHLEVLRATVEAMGQHDFTRLMQARVADLNHLLNGDTE